MPNVIIYAPTIGRGGVRRVIERLTEGFATRRGWGFTILSQKYDELGEPVNWPEKMQFIQINPVERLPSHPNQLPFLAEHRADFYNHLRRVVAEGDYSAVLCLSPSWAFTETNLTVGIPVISFVPDFAFDHIDLGVTGDVLRNTLKLTGKQSDHVIFGSDFQRAWGEKYYGYEKATTVYFSSDASGAWETSEEQREAVQEIYGLPNEYVLAFHCYGHKGAEDVIKAQYTARTTSGKVPPLVIAGLQTELYTQSPPANMHVATVQGLLTASKATLGRDVFILGTLPEEHLPGLYSGAHVAMIATSSEGGLSASVLEAINSGVPVVATALPAFTERLPGELTYFQLGDAAEAGRKLAQVCEDYEAAKQKALELKRTLGKRTFKDVVSDYLNVIKEVIK